MRNRAVGISAHGCRCARANGATARHRGGSSPFGSSSQLEWHGTRDATRCRCTQCTTTPCDEAARSGCATTPRAMGGRDAATRSSCATTPATRERLDLSPRAAPRRRARSRARRRRAAARGRARAWPAHEGDGTYMLPCCHVAHRLPTETVASPAGHPGVCKTKTARVTGRVRERGGGRRRPRAAVARAAVAARRAVVVVVVVVAAGARRVSGEQRVEHAPREV